MVIMRRVIQSSIQVGRRSAGERYPVSAERARCWRRLLGNGIEALGELPLDARLIAARPLDRRTFAVGAEVRQARDVRIAEDLEASQSNDVIHRVGACAGNRTPG